MPCHHRHSFAHSSVKNDFVSARGGGGLLLMSVTKSFNDFFQADSPCPVQDFDMKKKSTRSLCFPRGLQYLIAMLKLWIKSSPVAENDRVCNIAFCTPRPHRAFYQRVTSKSPWRLLASLAMSYLDPLNDSFALMRKGLASGYNCPLGGGGLYAPSIKDLSPVAGLPGRGLLPGCNQGRVKARSCISGRGK